MPLPVLITDYSSRYCHQGRSEVVTHLKLEHL